MSRPCRLCYGTGSRFVAGDAGLTEEPCPCGARPFIASPSFVPPVMTRDGGDA